MQPSSCRRYLIGMALLALVSVPTLVTTAGSPASAKQPPHAALPGPVSLEDPAGGYGRLMLVLDSSGSMAEQAGGGQTKIAAAKSALTTLIGELPPEAPVGLRVFGAKVFSRTDPGSCEDTQQIVKPGIDNRKALLDAVGRYQPYGETPIPSALRAAAADLGNEGARSIVLVSDGESTCLPDPCKVAADLTKKGIDLKIDVVGLSVSDEARDQLRCIAEKGNGTYYDADNAADIEGQLTAVAERAIRPFVLTGQPIQGGPVSDPTPLTVGDWVDTLGSTDSESGSKSYLFERTISGTTLRASAITQGQRGDDGLHVEIFDPEGKRCDVGVAIRQIDAREIVGVQVTTSEDKGCDAPGVYRITVNRSLGEDSDISFGLRVSEEPAIIKPGFLSTSSEAEVTAPQVSGPAQAVTGGSSFANAAQIGPGRWNDTVVPGEALLYRFPLEFGELARISVTLPKATGAAAELVSPFSTFSVIQMYNPMQAQLSKPDDGELSGASGRDDLTMVTATPAISRALVDFGGFNGVDDYSMAGDYYLDISMMREDYTIEFPLTIEVEIVGGPAAGPTYADDATWNVAEGATYPNPPTEPSGPTDPGEPTTAPNGEESAPPIDSQDGGLTSSTIATLVGIAGLAALAGAALLRRRRRA